MEKAKELLEEYYDLEKDYNNGWSDFWKAETWNRFNYLIIKLKQMGLIK